MTDETIVSQDSPLAVGSDYSIQPRSIIDINAQQYDLLWKIAGVYAVSTFGGSKSGKAMSQNDAFVALMLGIELGFKPMNALQHISVIQGKPSLDGKGMLSVIHASGLLSDMKVDGNDKRCKVTMTRSNGITYSATFTIEQAKDAGLIKSGGAWEKYPERMLEWRCVAFCARVLFPDVIGGVYTPEELAENVLVEPDGTMTIASAMKSPDQLRAEMVAQLIEENYYANQEDIVNKVVGYKAADGENYRRPYTVEDYEALYQRLVADARKVSK